MSRADGRLERVLRDLRGERRTPAIVAPLYWTGLNVVRALRRHDVPVLALDTAPRRNAAFTRLCPTIVVEGQAGLWDALERLGEGLDRPALFLTTDHDIVRASAEREEVCRRFRLRLPEPDVFSLLIDKLLFAEFALEHELPVPQTFAIREGEGWDGVVAHGRFPLLVKPKFRSARWRAAGLEKVYRAGDAGALESLLDRLGEVEGDFVVQEWIPGGESQLCFHVAYFGADGMPLTGFSGQKLRQWPPLVGSSAVSRPARDPEVARQAVRLLRLAGLRGLGSVEFKRDPRDGLLKVMEPSVGRATLGGGLALANGVNVYYRAYCDLCGIEPEPEPQPARPRHWILLGADLMAVGTGRRQTQPSWREIVGPYRQPKTFGDLAADDPLPFVAELAELGAHALARFGRAVRSRTRASTAAPPRESRHRRKEEVLSGR